MEDQDIQITGDTKFAVAMACNRIDAIVSSARQRQGFTHFISVPCNSIEMQTSYKGMYQSQIVLRSKVLRHHFYLPKVIIHVQNGN